jgi:hypothetical protein
MTRHLLSLRETLACAQHVDLAIGSVERDFCLDSLRQINLLIGTVRNLVRGAG